MTPEYRDVIVALIVLLGAVVSEFGRRESKRATKAASLAADRSEPTGNGFAVKVTDALDRIESRQDRADNRAERTERAVSQLRRQLTEHLDGGA